MSVHVCELVQVSVHGHIICVGGGGREMGELIPKSTKLKSFKQRYIAT